MKINAQYKRAHSTNAPQKNMITARVATISSHPKRTEKSALSMDAMTLTATTVSMSVAAAEIPIKFFARK